MFIMRVRVLLCVSFLLSICNGLVVIILMNCPSIFIVKLNSIDLSICCLLEGCIYIFKLLFV